MTKTAGGAADLRRLRHTERIEADGNVFYVTPDQINAATGLSTALTPTRSS